MKKFTSMSNDIAFEVLSRFSAKILHRMKFVCKEWQSLVSDHTFIRSQLKNTQPLSGFFFQEKYQYVNEDIERISYIPLETTEVHCSVFNFLPERVVLLSLCNGLVCCRSIFPSSNPLVYVCNPLNKEWISFKWIHPTKGTNVALDFDPIRTPIGDGPTNFQVVSVNQSITVEHLIEESESVVEEIEFSFDVYSSETRNWTRSMARCVCEHELSKNKGIFIDGFLYWLTDGGEILMFNPVIDFSSLIAMPIPITEFEAMPDMCIGESKGKLHYVVLSEVELQLWVLKDQFASHWDVTFSISLKNLEEENPDILFQFSEKLKWSRNIDKQVVVDLLAFKDDVLFVRVLNDIFSFQFATRIFKRLCNISQLGRYAHYSPIVLPYSMSLVPLI